MKDASKQEEKGGEGVSAGAIRRKRYELARLAMSAMLSNPNEDVVRSLNIRPYGNGFQFNFYGIAREAFEMADAMLKKEKEVKA